MENNKGINTKHSYHISGMHCGGCAKTVEQKLAALPQVKTVKVDLEKKLAQVESENPISLSTLQAALVNTSYAIEERVN